MASSSETSPATEFIWTHARVLEAEVAISASIASSLLPAALRLEDPPTATLFVADYPETRFGSVYREAAVLLHAADTKGPALHCPWMVVDDDTALILGRGISNIRNRHSVLLDSASFFTAFLFSESFFPLNSEL